MATYRSDADTIKANVTMRLACEVYGIDVNRHGFARCPFHGGDNTPSFKIYDSSFYCYGCNVGGDVIALVKELFGLDFKQAVAKIDGDFNLGLQKPLTDFDRQQINHRKAERERRDKDRQAKIQAYWTLFATWVKYDKIICEQRPTPYSEPTGAFIEAITNIKRIEYELDLLDAGGEMDRH